MSAEFFLDTNIIVYTFDEVNTGKQARARALVESALNGGSGVVSSQVVQEFLNVATRKFPVPLAPDAALRYLGTVLEPLCTVFPSIALYERAMDLQERWKFSFYDSLIVGSALEAGCEILYTEDLSHGQKVETLAIVDPFVPTKQE